MVKVNFIFSKELNDIVNYIENNIYTEYPCDKLDSTYYVISVIENIDSIAYKILSKNLMESQLMEIRDKCYEKLASSQQQLTDSKFNFIDIVNDDVMENITDNYTDFEELNSGMVFGSLLKLDSFLIKLFKSYGVTYKHFKSNVIEEYASVKKTTTDTKDNTSKKSNKKDTVATSTKSNTSLIKYNEANEVERYLVNINALCVANKVDTVIGNEEVINDIFKVLAKKNNNNAIVVGDSGVGKTATVRYIAKMINEGNVPELYKDKVLSEINFSALISGMLYKGAFEARLKAIIEDAKKSGKYIFFIDDIDSLIENPRYAEGDVDILLSSVLNESKIRFICTSSVKGYSKLISNYPNFIKKMGKIEIEECNDKLALDILIQSKEKYEQYHEVIYPKKVLKTCIDICRKHFPKVKLPCSALELIDEVGAASSLIEKENPVLKELNEQLVDIQIQKDLISNDSNKDYDKIDELTKKEIKLKALIAVTEKSDKLNKEPTVITEKNVFDIVSKKLGINVAELNKTEKIKLKNINDELKAIVIGQDTAVDAVCKIVKRQKMGLSNPQKPSVLMFTGTTGTGKTYLAKKLAEKIYGDEKHLVRLDMSEYADKMSVSKLVGASSGYIGYNDTPVLFEAYNKMKQFVLLLDECEKADESVFNVFLQVFDEGRLTNNKGETIDLKDIIVILTSNVGAKEVSERNGGVGFATNMDDKNSFEESLFKKAIKRHFKPEFINRIDSIIYFNKLNDDNLKKIIKLQIDVTNNKLKKIGYSLDKDIYETLTEEVLKNISDKKKYGARPILREIEKLLENKITDLLIEKNIKKGYSFKYSDIAE